MEERIRLHFSCGLYGPLKRGLSLQMAESTLMSVCSKGIRG